MASDASGAASVDNRGTREPGALELVIEIALTALLAGIAAKAQKGGQPLDGSGPSGLAEAGGASGVGHDAGGGHGVRAPAEIPARGWKDILWRVYEGIARDRLLLVSAGVTFYGLLALFPATAAIVALYGLFTDPASIREQLSLLAGFLPDGAIQVIGDQMTRIAAHQGRGLGLAFAGGLAISLWGANAGTKSVFDALNIIYKEDESRGFFKLNAQSLAFTVAAILLLTLVAACVIALPVVLNTLGVQMVWLQALRWPLLLVAVLFALACLYRFGPSRATPQWRWVTWGSVLAGLVWLGASMLFSWYVANFGSYNATYGSLGAVIGFMTWMWLSTIIMLVGGEINAEIEHQAARDTTAGERSGIRARGAS